MLCLIRGITTHIQSITQKAPATDGQSITFPSQTFNSSDCRTELIVVVSYSSWEQVILTFMPRVHSQKLTKFRRTFLFGDLYGIFHRCIIVHYIRLCISARLGLQNIVERKLQGLLIAHQLTPSSLKLKLHHFDLFKRTEWQTMLCMCALIATTHPVKNVEEWQVIFPKVVGLKFCAHSEGLLWK